VEEEASQASQAQEKKDESQIVSFAHGTCCTYNTNSCPASKCTPASRPRHPEPPIASSYNPHRLCARHSVLKSPPSLYVVHGTNLLEFLAAQSVHDAFCVEILGRVNLVVCISVDKGPTSGHSGHSTSVHCLPDSSATGSIFGTIECSRESRQYKDNHGILPLNFCIMMQLS
jgi:hypothetical protein